MSWLAGLGQAPRGSMLSDLSARLHVYLSQLPLGILVLLRVILFNFSSCLHLSFGHFLSNRAGDLDAKRLGHLRMSLDPASIESNTVLSPRKNKTANQANKQISA